MATMIAAALVATTPVLAPSAVAQERPHGAQLQARILPVAAGALVGAAAGFFLLPLLVPATAAAATAGVSATATPVFAVIGAGLGGVVGYEYLP
jgi:hypothetical protein